MKGDNYHDNFFYWIPGLIEAHIVIFLYSVLDSYFGKDKKRRGNFALSVCTCCHSDHSIPDAPIPFVLILKILSNS